MHAIHMIKLALAASAISGLGVLVFSQCNPHAGLDKNDTAEHSLRDIAGPYSFAPELCDDPDMLVKITDYAVDFSAISASTDIKFEAIDYRLVDLPLTGKTPSRVGIWRTSNSEMRTSLFSTISRPNLQLLELKPSKSTRRDVLGYTVYDFDAADRFDNFSDWAPNFIEGYALYPCDSIEASSEGLKLPS